jgi:5-methylcytosine-specific restriction endonuclease McrA
MDNMEKRCPSCQETKPLAEFNKDKSNASGYKSRCRACTIRDKRAAYQADPERFRASARRSYHSQKADPVRHAAHLARRRDYCRRWREKNRSHVRATIYNWQTRNRERLKVIADRRLARKAENGGSFTAQEWAALCQQYDYRCLACGRKRKLSADHIVPLSKGGASSIDNIQPLCGPCNSGKGDKIIDYRR